MKNTVGWLVTETYRYSYCKNPPENWELERVLRRDEPGSNIFFRNGKVIGMPLGCRPIDQTKRDIDAVFVLELDGGADGNDEFTWKAFSTKKAAEAWIASRKSA